ncbi:hypothetical protein [Corynebacterium freiburgense]|uniref:hypothetical protein n=1 Tax=Corynebacterium freiburgense TaxID=556548 RepID=UPI000429151C|nr:hypothetical protein [Corynebacterium freiburgense]WJZ02597.1 hypothetical protein CFREI_06555 [Corynebacterium freiburgense]
MEANEKRCEWCGKPIVVENTRGRPRRYCNRSCRQRAYEQRNQKAGKTIPLEGIHLAPDRLEHFHDQLFTLRCAAEDIHIATQDEQPDQEEIQRLCNELIQLAKAIENSY